MKKRGFGGDKGGFSSFVAQIWPIYHSDDSQKFLKILWDSSPMPLSKAVGKVEKGTKCSWTFDFFKIQDSRFIQDFLSKIT